MKHRTISLADQVFERLENDIISGKYQRGQILTELGLTEDLGVSRTPIREALQRLKQQVMMHTVTISEPRTVTWMSPLTKRRFSI